MLLTDSSGGRVSLTAFVIPFSALFLVPIVAPREVSWLLLYGRGPWQHLFRAVALRVVELLALLDGGRFDLRADHVAHRREPLRNDLPLLPVPLLDQHG